MNNVTLIAFGFGWMVVAAILGLFLGAKHEVHLGGLAKAAFDNNLLRYHEELERFKWRSSVHAHGMLFALSSVAIGVMLPRTGLEPLETRIIIAAVMALTIAWTLAALWRFRPVMAIADIAFTIVLVVISGSLALIH